MPNTITAGNLTLVNTNTEAPAKVIIFGGNRFISNYGSNNTFGGQTSVNTTVGGSNNIGSGTHALPALTKGASYTALGYSALRAATTEGYNTAWGVYALQSTLSGFGNTAKGNLALQNNISGNDNTMVGSQSLISNTRGRGNVADKIVFNTTGIFGVKVKSTPVVCSSIGQLGVAPSSLRYKENVQPMDNSSSKLLECNPVTFNYKNEEKKHTHFGLIAEDLQNILPELVLKDEESNPEAIAYYEMPVLLLNEILKIRARTELLERKLTVTECVHRIDTNVRQLGNTTQVIGSWFTPGIAFGGNSAGILYSSAKGEYTQIDNIVIFAISIVLTSKGTSTGNATITGLPVAGGEQNTHAKIDWTRNFIYSRNYTNLSFLFGNGNTLSLYQFSPTARLIPATEANFSPNTSFSFSGFYFIS